MSLKDYLYFGGPGSGCHGDNCGRPSDHKPEKPSGWSSKQWKAYQSYVGLTLADRQKATNNEKKIARIIKGEHVGDNAPFDVIWPSEKNPKVAIEVKSLGTRKNERIDMKSKSIPLKKAFAKQHKSKVFTIGVEDRPGHKPVFYYREGVGAYSLSTMNVATSASELRKALLK